MTLHLNVRYLRTLRCLSSSPSRVGGGTRNRPSEPWVGCRPRSSFSGPHLCGGALFSHSGLPRLLLPRDKLSGSSPGCDRVKFRSNSAPSSSARVGTDRCALITAGLTPGRGLWGALGQAGGLPVTPHRDPTPENRLPCRLPVNSGPSSEERPPWANPRWPRGSGWVEP